MEISPLVHPKVVHLAIGWTLAGVGFTLAWLVWNRTWLRAAALVLAVAGAASLSGARQTGEAAEGAFEKTGRMTEAVHEAIETHEAWGTRAWIGSLLWAAFLGLSAWRRWSALWARGLAAALGLVLAYMLYLTGELGGELTYRYGVNVEVQHGSPGPATEEEEIGP
ncbi:MAG: DUF2231 domain-containing protein [Bacteroidota bacterium]|nr:hypothetical protein [Bacteroidota bacterium]MDW8137666.1 DUF2231 domain-containing protein [Bacteroidota bacterium]